MRVLARLCGVLVVAFSIAAVLSAPALAQDKRGFDLTFHLTSGNGYRIGVLGYGETALISAIKPSPPPHHQGSSSAYVARGGVSMGAIHARFADLGSVAMRFRPSGKVVHSKPRGGCRGPDRYTIRLGVFVGSLHFRGEGGYTSVDAHRVKGKVITPQQLECATPVPLARYLRGVSADNRSSKKITSLDAGRRLGTAATYLTAITTRDKARFDVVSQQSEGSIAIYRRAFAFASPLTFAFDNALSFASISPPAPFTGTGSFQRGLEGSRSWTGSLAVSFPGEPDVPLTGPEFQLRLSRSL